MSLVRSISRSLRFLIRTRVIHRPAKYSLLAVLLLTAGCEMATTETAVGEGSRPQPLPFAPPTPEDPHAIVSPESRWREKFRQLGISGTVHLNAEGRMTRVHFSGRRMHDSIIQLLLDEPQLNAVAVVNSGMTDAQLIRLAKGRPGLERLELFDEDSLTDAAMPAVGQLQQLKRLVLPRTVTDVGFAELAPLQQLTELRAVQARITDASLPLLKSLKNLKSLNLMATRVTLGATDELAEHLPHCEVFGADGNRPVSVSGP